ncbi:hypothetical protein AJ78_02257 [Emergomyces pasteurianus Ep9510]|uniref:Uncharacterized protein n=1 Tax=Emergomyces pasteurianus Ep9510 TaxID=1447872 RepID=A0A1J9PP51_9EURO|nr:hypothetical protein AJ78_02257 [Emergomyces pasteurianus Ep9510]
MLLRVVAAARLRISKETSSSLSPSSNASTTMTIGSGKPMHSCASGTRTNFSPLGTGWDQSTQQRFVIGPTSVIEEAYRNNRVGGNCRNDIDYISPLWCVFASSIESAAASKALKEHQPFRLALGDSNDNALGKIEASLLATV